MLSLLLALRLLQMLFSRWRLLVLLLGLSTIPAHSAPSFYSENALYDFLLRGRPSLVGAEQFFESLETRPRLRARIAKIMAKSPRFVKAAEQGNLYRQQYRDLFEVEFPPGSPLYDIATNPQAKVKTSFDRFRLSQKTMQDVPIPDRVAYQKAKDKIYKPLRRQDSDPESLVMPKGGIEWQFFRKQYGRWKNHTERKLKNGGEPSGEALSAWKSQISNLIDEARLKNLAQATRAALLLDRELLFLPHDPENDKKRNLPEKRNQKIAIEDLEHLEFQIKRNKPDEELVWRPGSTALRKYAESFPLLVGNILRVHDSLLFDNTKMSETNIPRLSTPKDDYGGLEEELILKAKPNLSENLSHRLREFGLDGYIELGTAADYLLGLYAVIGNNEAYSSHVHDGLLPAEKSFVLESYARERELADMKEFVLQAKGENAKQFELRLVKRPAQEAKLARSQREKIFFPSPDDEDRPVPKLAFPRTGLNHPADDIVAGVQWSQLRLNPYAWHARDKTAIDAGAPHFGKTTRDGSQIPKGSFKEALLDNYFRLPSILRAASLFALGTLGPAAVFSLPLMYALRSHKPEAEAPAPAIIVAKEDPNAAKKPAIVLVVPEDKKEKESNEKKKPETEALVPAIVVAKEDPNAVKKPDIVLVVPEDKKEESKKKADLMVSKNPPKVDPIPSLNKIPEATKPTESKKKENANPADLHGPLNAIPVNPEPPPPPKPKAGLSGERMEAKNIPKNEIGEDGEEKEATQKYKIVLGNLKQLNQVPRVFDAARVFHGDKDRVLKDIKPSLSPNGKVAFSILGLEEQTPSKHGDLEILRADHYRFAKVTVTDSDGRELKAEPIKDEQGKTIAEPEFKILEEQRSALPLIRLTHPEAHPGKTFKVNVDYEYTSKSIENRNNKLFTDLDPQKLHQLNQWLEDVGANELASQLEEMVRQKEKSGTPINLGDLERILKYKGPEYTYKPETGKPHWDKKNPFWEVSKFLRPVKGKQITLIDGITRQQLLRLYWQCSGGNECGLDYEQAYFGPNSKIEAERILSLKRKGGDQEFLTSDSGHARVSSQTLDGKHRWITDYTPAIVEKEEPPTAQEKVAALEKVLKAKKAAAEKAEAEKARKLEAERIAKEKAEQERIAKIKAEEIRIAKEKAEAARIAKEKIEKEEKAKAEAVAKAKAQQEHDEAMQKEARLKWEKDHPAGPPPKLTRPPHITLYDFYRLLQEAPEAKKYLPFTGPKPNLDEDERLEELNRLVKELRENYFYKNLPRSLFQFDLPTERVLKLARTISLYAISNQKGYTKYGPAWLVASIGKIYPNVPAKEIKNKELLAKALKYIAHVEKKRMNKLQVKIRQKQVREIYTPFANDLLLDAVRDLYKHIAETDWNPLPLPPEEPSASPNMVSPCKDGLGHLTAIKTK